MLGQLDKDTIKVVDGKLQGFEEQLKGLQESKSFLFQEAKDPEPTPPTPTIVTLEILLVLQRVVKVLYKKFKKD